MTIKKRPARRAATTAAAKTQRQPRARVAVKAPVAVSDTVATWPTPAAALAAAALAVPETAQSVTPATATPGNPMTPIPPNTASTLAFGPSLSIREAAASAIELRRAIEVGIRQIDVTALEAIDTAGLQLLLAASTAAHERGQKLKVVGANRMLSDAVAALGLGKQFAAVWEVAS